MKSRGSWSKRIAMEHQSNLSMRVQRGLGRVSSSIGLQRQQQRRWGHLSVDRGDGGWCRQRGTHAGTCNCRACSEMRLQGHGQTGLQAAPPSPPARPSNFRSRPGPGSALAVLLLARLPSPTGKACSTRLPFSHCCCCCRLLCVPHSRFEGVGVLAVEERAERGAQIRRRLLSLGHLWPACVRST